MSLNALFFVEVECEEVSDIRCTGYIHHLSGFPNALGGRDYVHSSRILDRLLSLEQFNCYSSLIFFACATSFPECNGGRLKYPCKSFCLGNY